jgi:hypothetical protein
MDKPVQENIEERILKLLGLEFEFEMSYEEYNRHLRTALIEAQMVKSSFSSEEAVLLQNERNRIKNKKGRFYIKVKKTTVKNIPLKNNKAINFIRPPKDQKLLSGKVNKVEKPPKETESLLDIVVAIRKTVDSIHKNIENQSKFIKSISDKNRKEQENKRRKSKEEKLEKKKNPALELAEKIAAPFQSIFDKILNFLVFTILGRAFKLFMDWAGDPKNKEKVESIKRFLGDWWPALLGAWFFFANPLGRFIRSIIGTVAKLTFRLAKFAIPKLLQFAKANPKTAAAAAIIGTAYLANEVTGQREAAPIQAENKAKVQTGKTTEVRGTDTGIDKSPSVGDMGPTTPYGLLQPVSKGGFIGLNNGGSVFSGIVDKDTGETVSGAGPDTQFLPVAEGGGAVLQKGEVVLQKGARERMIQDAGVDPLAYNIGSNANKPRSIGANILASSYGGLIGLSNGGEIGNTNPNFWSLAAISAKEAGYIPQGQADVAQSLYNRSSVGIYPGGKDIKKIITAPGQYQPTFKNPGAWNSVKDKNSATAVVGDSKLIDMAASSISNPILQRNASNFIGSRTDFMGESQKKNMKPDKGDITRGKRHNFFGWFTDNGYKSKLSKSAPIPPFISNNNSSNTYNNKPTENKKSPSMFDNIQRTAQNIFNFGKGTQASPQKKQGGGKIVGESSGFNIPGATADRQLFPIMGGGTAALHPGEGIVPRDVMYNIGEDGFNRFIAAFESGRNSNAAKLGYVKPKVNIPEPPIKKGKGGNMITLPPITQSAGSQISANSSSAGSVVPSFSAISSASLSVRQNNADIYGIA